MTPVSSNQYRSGANTTMIQGLPSLARTVNAGLLAWLIPGAGHWMLGMRGLAAVYFGAISFAYWAGMLIGGVKTSVDPIGNFWIFLAEMGVGAYTAVCYLIASTIKTVPVYEPSPYVSYFPGSDIAQIYLSVAGLLNVLAVLDAIARSQTNGLPVFFFEEAAKQAQQQAQQSPAPSQTAPPSQPAAAMTAATAPAAPPRSAKGTA